MQLARKNTLDARQLMKEIEACIAEIKFLLGGLFDRFIEVESGRDSLTRLLNRRHLPSVLTREVTLSRKTGVPFTLLMLDIDHFKNINDSFGHDAGDMVLQQAADMIASCVRAGDFVFRVGGEEFLILLVEIDKVAALKVAEAIRKRVAIEPFRIGDAKNTNVTVSIGIATYNGHPDYQVAIKNADEALFEAKNTGRNRCAISGN
jgi:diguanylate cyclase